MLIRSLTFAALALCAATTYAADRGYFGFAIAVDGEGFFLNPTLKSVRIEKVEPKSPAANAGIAAGDLIVEVEGRVVAGTKADDLKPYLRRDVGQSTRLVVKKPGGQLQSLVLVAAPKQD